MTVLRPEFYVANYIDPKFNQDAVVTITPTAKWYQDNKKYLYDNEAGYILEGYNKGVLYSSGSDVASDSLVITADLGSTLLIDVIRVCNTNIKDLLIEISYDATTWTTLKTVTDNASDFISWYTLDSTMYPLGSYYLATDLNSYIVTSAGARIQLNSIVPFGSYARYVRFTFATTQVTASEKYIGELYIGRLFMRPEDITLMSDTFSDSNSSELTMYNNKTNRKVNRATFSQQLAFPNQSQTEFDLLKFMINTGVLLNYVPNPLGLTGLTNNFTGKDIYLIQARSQEFNYQSYGQSADGSVGVNIKEAAYVTRRY